MKSNYLMFSVKYKGFFTESRTQDFDKIPWNQNHTVNWFHEIFFNVETTQQQCSFAPIWKIFREINSHTQVGFTEISRKLNSEAFSISCIVISRKNSLNQLFSGFHFSVLFPNSQCTVWSLRNFCITVFDHKFHEINDFNK